jgi:Domain of unknown function (DUF4157)
LRIKLMSCRSTTTTNQKPTSSFTPIQTGLLQRKGTSCGQRSIDSRESNCTQQKNSLQRKLTIGASNDPLEQEADRIADQVLAAPANTTISSSPSRIQRFTGQTTNQAEVAPASVDRVLSSSGSPLEPGLQQDMRQRFGHDFSRVRVHTGAEADRSTQDVNANAYTVGHNIVFGADRFKPETNTGRHLIAHELTHVIQQSNADKIHNGQSHKMDNLGFSPLSIQRQVNTENQAKPIPDMKRIYSFGPTGAGRAVKGTDTTIFSPAAPVDAKGNELVRAGTKDAPIMSRFGRYFTLDERHQAYPPPIPSCSVKAITEWTPDDGSATSKDQKEDVATTYYQAGEPLGTKLGEQYIFPNDRPGILSLAYVFASNGDFILLSHGVHFVNDSSAPIGSNILPDKPKGQESTMTAPIEAKKATNGEPVNKPDNKTTPGVSLPPPPATPNNLALAVGQIKELTELIQKTSDAAKKDPLIRNLRDLLSKLTPFIKTKDAQKMIDNAIESFVKDTTNNAIMSLLTTITGRSPTTMPENRNQTGPNMPEKDLGTRIFQGPKITINDVPKPRTRFSFEYRNGPKKSYEAGSEISFTLIPPDDFSSLPGAKRLVIVADSDRSLLNPERLHRVSIESASPQQIVLKAPEKPGNYVIRVDTGLGFDYSSIQNFEVTAPQSK